MKIKVLQVIGNLKIGGAETVAMNLYRYINRDKYEFHYLVYDETVGDYEKEVLELGGKVIHVNYQNKIFNREYIKKIKEINDKYGPYQIIHAHLMFHNGLVLKAAKKIGIPVRISHAHSTDDGRKKKSIIDYLIGKVYIFLARNQIRKNATIFFACGNQAGNCLYGENFFRNNGKLINNGIDIDSFLFDVEKRTAMRKKYCMQDNLIIGCIGHFERVKNHEYVLKIFCEIHKKNKKARLYLIGDGNLREEIQNKVKELNLEKEIVFTGNVNNVSDWMQALDCIVMPSLYEGVPLVLIEAQVAGLQCFVSENISKEVNLINKVIFLPLNDSCDGWMDIANLNINYNRKINSNVLRKKGFDVKSNIKEVEKIYDKLGDIYGYEKHV